MTEIQMEGQPIATQAVIDTGSPVSLISIDFLPQTLLPGVGREMTPAEKNKALRNRLEPPSMAIKNFGEHKVNVIY